MSLSSRFIIQPVSWPDLFAKMTLGTDGPFKLNGIKYCTSSPRGAPECTVCGRKGVKNHGSCFPLRSPQGQATVVQAISHNDDVVLGDCAGFVVDFITHLARFKDDNLKMIRAVGWNTVTAVQDQETDINRIGTVKRPHVQFFTIDLSIYKGTCRLPLQVAISAHARETPRRAMIRLGGHQGQLASVLIRTADYSLFELLCIFHVQMTYSGLSVR